MDNKLSELSKPVAWKFKNADGGDRVSLERKANIYGRHDFQPLYSQEYVSALLAELEEKDTPKDIRVAEIEKRLKQRAEEMERILEGITPEMIAGGWTAKGISDYAKSLEAKLATPVRLQSPWVDKVGNRWLLEGTTADVIRAAGFKIEGED